MAGDKQVLVWYTWIMVEISEHALWRYSVIAPLLHLPQGTSLSEAARAIAREVKRGPNGEEVVVSQATVLRWYREWQQGGVEALARRARSDRGTRRSLSDKEIALLLDLAEEHPAWTVQAIRRRAQNMLGKQLSVKAIYRLLPGHRKEVKPVQGFPQRELGVPQALWIADTWHGPAVYGARRKKQRTYLIAIMDDASRAIMAGRFVLRDDVMNLIPILREAVLARGIPQRLLTDNGPNYRARVVRTACATLGIHLIHARPYRPTAKARLERFFLTVKMQLLPELGPFPKLRELNTAWNRFLADYHGRPHAGLTEQTGRVITPLSYYLTHLPEDVRHISEVTLDELLVVEETRKVKNDGTFRLPGQVWDAGVAFAGEWILVRFQPPRPPSVTFRLLSDKQAPFQTAYLISQGGKP